MPLYSNRVRRLHPWTELAGFLAAGAVVLCIEAARIPGQFTLQDVVAYTPNPETTWVGLALLVSPLLWWLGGTGFGGNDLSNVTGDAATGDGGTPERAGPAPLPRIELVTCWAMSALLGCLSITLTWSVGRAFRSMPPAYHDEYSYLFQAKTFLAGRLYFPTHPYAEFFDQMHVLNDDGVFASRYFPGVAIWLAPWVAIDRLYWGQYLAGGLIVVCAFWIGRELLLHGDAAASRAQRRYAFAAGVVAALSVAISPAMLLFGNLLLSHHPTMLGLAVFTISYLRALRSAAWGWPVMGGIGLSFAMLCRPLTAFGFALPFALYLGWLVARGELERARVRLTAALAPVAVGIVLLAAYNAAITGNPLRSPYGKYTQIYAPNHRYGFHNVTRGERDAGPKTIENYNRWAEELTLPRAIALSGERASASALWSVGRVSVAWIAGILVVSFTRLATPWKLLIGSIAGVHAVYFPFAFVGIYGLSYVFETVPLIAILVGAASVMLTRDWLHDRRWGRAAWIVAFGILGLYAPMLRLGSGMHEVLYARRYYADFDRQLEQAGVAAPALVMIMPDPADRDRELTAKSPALDDPILRVRADRARRWELITMFPQHQLWFYDARSKRLVQLVKGEQSLPPVDQTQPQ